MLRIAGALILGAAVTGITLPVVSVSASTTTPREQRAIARAEHWLAQFDRRGTVTGIVLGPNGAPQANVCVTAAGQLTTSSAFTKPDGRFIIGRLPLGAYKVSYQGCSPIANVTAQWYGGRSQASAAQVLLLNASPVQIPTVTLRPFASVFSGVRSASRANGSLAGVVKNSSGKPLAGMCVFAQSSTYGTAQVTTDAKGRYRLTGVPPGFYQVAFSPGGAFFGCKGKGNYLPTVKNAAVHSGATTTVNAVLPTGGVMSGVVKDSRGKPLAGICVFSFAQAAGGNPRQVITGRNGTFRLDQLFTGTYVVGFMGGCGNSESVAPQDYNGDPTGVAPNSISVTEGKTTPGINASMRPGGILTGRAADQAGRPLGSICVTILATTAATGSGGFAGVATTDNSGSYSATNMPPGQYLVLFSNRFTKNSGCAASPYADQYFRSVGLAGTPDRVSVFGGTETKGVNVTLVPAGEISGVIRSKAGRPVPFCATAIGIGSTATNAAVSLNNGRYLIPNLPAGRYHVEFTNCLAGSGLVTPPNFADQWYSRSSTEHSARTIAVVGGHVTTHIDAALTPGGSIAGQVLFRQDKRPIDFVCVAAMTSDQAIVDRGITDRRGKFLLTGLTPGRYRLELAPCILESALGAQVNPGSVKVVASHTTRGVVAEMTVGGTVTGVAQQRSGAATRRAPGTCVEFVPLTPNLIGLSTNAAFGGAYTVRYLAPGKYLPVFGDPACSFNAATMSELATAPVTVTSGRITGHVDATLLSAGGISGTVRAAGGHPVAGICAEAFPLGGDVTVPFAPVVGISTGSGYAIAGLQPGKYKVSFSPGCGATGYATRWYKNAKSANHATIIQVRAATTMKGINITLPRG